MKIKYKEILSMYAMLLPQNTPILETEFTEEEIGRAFQITLKALRYDKNVSLKAMSEAIEIPPQTINRYENGTNIPTITQAIKITNYFDIPLEIFITLGLSNIYENADIAKAYHNFKEQMEQTAQAVQMIVQMQNLNSAPKKD